MSEEIEKPVIKQKEERRNTNQNWKTTKTENNNLYTKFQHSNNVVNCAVSVFLVY